MIRHPFSSTVIRAVAFFFLALGVVAIYAPSLWHVARGDQINYLAELASRHGFWDTVCGTFDLNRTRLFGAGDELAFRPLLYVMLGLEKYLFGYHFMGWQAVALAAHLFVCGALYVLLGRIRGWLFAWLLTAWFALAPVNIEAVTWHHITPYLVFAGCVLMALRGLYAARQDPARAGALAAGAAGWMLPAVFLYETGVWYAACMAVMAFVHRWRAAGYFFLAAIAAYLCANVMDLFWRHADAALQAGEVAGKGAALSTLWHAVLLGKWSLSALFFLAPADLIPVTRMMVRPEVVGWGWPWGQPLSLVLVSGAVAGMLAMIVLGRGVWQGKLVRERACLSLCGAMLVGYLLVIALGRINVQGDFALRVGLYYPYNALILIMVAAAFIMPDDTGKNKKWWLLFKVVGVCVMVWLLVSCAFMTRQMVARMAREHQQNRVFLAALDRYVREHRGETGFSFYVSPGYPGNYTADWVTRRGDPSNRSYTVAEAFYPAYYTRHDPKYVIKYEQ